MAELVIQDEALAQRIRRIAQEEGRPVDDVLRSMVGNYEAKTARRDPLESFNDVFRGKSLDLTRTVRATEENHYRKKYGDSD
jgi:hypothetical protein